MKLGSVVFAYGFVNYGDGSAIPADTVLFNVPSGFRPTNKTEIFGSVFTGTSAAGFVFAVGTSGNIKQERTNNFIQGGFSGFWYVG